MGKAEDVLPLQSTSLDAQGTIPGAGSSDGCCLSCSRVRKLVSFKCVLVLVLGVAVFLSALFWLPFFHFRDHQDPDLDFAGHDVVASFMLNKPASFLKDYILQLEDSIFDEMSFTSTKVEIISLVPAGPNTTKVVFAVDSDVTTRSLIKDSFVSLITNQSFLHLTAPLFGDPFSFDVLKFRGGITVIPDQKAYLLQSVQILFNFTLNFSIDQIINNFDELRSQLKTGLHLAPYENLYIMLSNLKGSTVSPPTIVRSQVLLAVGIPSESRLKQLAQTIKGSHTKNLGLNNTVFGRVKQVSLSSILQHSLGSDGGSPSPSPSSSPSPTSNSHHHRHHRHHHHHHHHHYPNLSPSVSPSPSIVSGSPISTPVPAPAPANTPPCHFGYKNRFPWKHKHPQMAPLKPPVYAPYVAPTQPKQTNKLTPKSSPVPAKGPSSNVAHAHGLPPSQSEYHARPPVMMSLMSPSPSPSSARTISSNIWALPLLILFGMHL